VVRPSRLQPKKQRRAMSDAIRQETIEVKRPNVDRTANVIAKSRTGKARPLRRPHWIILSGTITAVRRKSKRPAPCHSLRGLNI
jgi:hypothetical protein